MNLPKLTDEQRILWGESLVHDSKTLDKVNVRRLINYIQGQMTEFIEADLFVDSMLSGLKIIQKPVVQVQISKYHDYMESLLKNAKESRAINEYRIHDKGFVKSWEHKKDGTMIYTWHDGTTYELKTKFKPRRKVRVYAKRASRTTIGFDTKLALNKPAEFIKINMVLTKDGAEFK